MWPSAHELMCNNPQYQPSEAASWGLEQTQYQYLLARESDAHVLNHICLSPDKSTQIIRNTLLLKELFISSVMIDANHEKIRHIAQQYNNCY